jgi:hypothetical protein
MVKNPLRVAQTYALSNLGRQRGKILNSRRLIYLEIFMAKGKHSRIAQAMIAADNLPRLEVLGDVAEADTQFEIFDSSALKKQLLIFFLLAGASKRS